MGRKEGVPKEAGRRGASDVEGEQQSLLPMYRDVENQRGPSG